MAEMIADILVMVMPARDGLRSWYQSGVIAREWVLIKGMLARYGHVVFVTGDDADGAEFSRHVPDEPELARVSVVSVKGKGVDSAGVLREILAARPGAASAVVQSTELCCGQLPLQLASGLRASGLKVALVAQGGHVWTKYVSFEYGPNSPEAASAAEAEGALCRAADRVVGTTQGMVEDLAWRYGLDPSRCEVIPKFVLVDVPPTTSEERNPALVVYAGSLIKRKRVGIVIEAMAMLPEELRRDVTLEIIGDGPERAALEALAAKLSAPVVFRGSLPNPEVLARLRACALFVQPSAMEGQSTCVLEAMASGTPVLVAKSPGLEDVVTHGQSGLRLDANPEAFALAIEEALKDQDWRDVLGMTASRTTWNEFGLPRVLELTLAAHARAMAQGGRAAPSLAA